VRGKSLSRLEHVKESTEEYKHPPELKTHPGLRWDGSNGRGEEKMWASFIPASSLLCSIICLIDEINQIK
jgi:hypothetical protein